MESLQVAAARKRALVTSWTVEFDDSPCATAYPHFKQIETRMSDRRQPPPHSTLSCTLSCSSELMTSSPLPATTTPIPTLTLKSTNHRAAFLHLPHGVEIADAKALLPIKSFLRQHVSRLWEFAMKDKGRLDPDRSRPLDLCVVTGFHKTTDWGMAVLRQKVKSHNIGMRIDYPFSPKAVSINSPTYGMQKIQSDVPGLSNIRTGPDMPGPRNQCVFVRGYHILARKGFLRRQIDFIPQHSSEGPLRLRGGADTLDANTFGIWEDSGESHSERLYDILGSEKSESSNYDAHAKVG